MRAFPLFMRITGCLGILALLTGCSASGSRQPDSALAGDAIYIQDSWIRAAPAVGGNGALYMTIVNPTADADRLVAVETTIAEAAELHETVEDDGVMRMRPLTNGVDIPPKSIVELKPGAKHVMLLNVHEKSAEGQQAEVTLIFGGAGRRKMSVPVLEQSP